MAKRMTNTDKWKTKQLRAMPSAYKLLWLYIQDDCNHAGIWHVDFEVACMRVGEEVLEEKAIQIFGNEIKIFDGGEKWFIPEFIEVQYGELNEKNRVHESVLKELYKNKIETIRGLYAPFDGAKDKDKDKDKEQDKEQDKDKGGCGGENLLIPKMQTAWKNKSKGYASDIFRDSPALLSISKFICNQEKIIFNPYENYCIETVMNRWEHLCDHIPKHNFFKTYSLSQIDRHIQSIVLDIQNGNSNNGKSNTKITADGLDKAHAKYFG